MELPEESCAVREQDSCYPFYASGMPEPDVTRFFFLNQSVTSNHANLSDATGIVGASGCSDTGA